MVASTSGLASKAGMEILKKGGNAVDAAVAIGFVLAVVHPAAGNLGGGGFMVIHLAEQEREFTIDYREKAPLASHPKMFLDERGDLIEGLSTLGYLASGVPGSVAGLHLAWKEEGSLDWEELLTPAIRLAEEGFRVSYSLSESLRNSEEKLSQFAESRRIFLRDGKFYEEGETFRQPDLAMTLKLIARDGSGAFYEGPIARLIANQMEEQGGLITLDDLRGYEPRIRMPVRGSYRGVEIVSMGPPSSGGVVLIQMLNMLQGFPVKALGSGSSAELHLKAELMRRAFSDRAHFLGDPDFSPIPVEQLLAEPYAEKRAADVRPGWASPSSTVSHGEFKLQREGRQTTHYSVVDRWGNGVATTTTINGGYGSGVTIKGAGFLMNNEMDDFAAKPGEPNMFGLIQGEPNAIEPRKRPLSSMTPTLVKKNGKLYMVLGSPGGPRIINSVFQVISNVVDHELDIQEAVDRLRIHHQWLPDTLYIEESVVNDVLNSLDQRGHDIKFLRSIGDVHAILIDPKERVFYGAADPRSDGQAIGY